MPLDEIVFRAKRSASIFCLENGVSRFLPVSTALHRRRLTFSEFIDELYSSGTNYVSTVAVNFVKV